MADTHRQIIAELSTQMEAEGRDLVARHLPAYDRLVEVSWQISDGERSELDADERRALGEILAELVRHCRGADEVAVTALSKGVSDELTHLGPTRAVRMMADGITLTLHGSGGEEPVTLDPSDEVVQALES